MCSGVDVWLMGWRYSGSIVLPLFRPDQQMRYAGTTIGAAKTGGGVAQPLGVKSMDQRSFRQCVPGPGMKDLRF